MTPFLGRNDGWLEIGAEVQESPLKELVVSGDGEQHLTLRRLMSYIYGAPILDVSRSHTTTQHSR